MPWKMYLLVIGLGRCQFHCYGRKEYLTCDMLRFCDDAVVDHTIQIEAGFENSHLGL